MSNYVLCIIKCFSWSAILIFGFAKAATDIESFYPEAIQFDQSITQPEVFLGHRLGDQMVRNDRMTAYFQQLATQSNRVKYEVIGYSNEQRPIITLTISSPENLQNLSAIRENHIALQKLSNKVSNLENMPVVSWINFGVHGGEVSSNDSAMPIAYHLAAAQGKAIDDLLANSVILLTASMNPDGNSRESAWNLKYTSNVIITDPNHALHSSPWPSGRTNHYWFDLNRQWMLQQQPEPISWVRKFHEWRPNIVADFHEMASYKSFYFHPGAPDRVHPLINKQAMNLLSDVVQNSRDFLDSEAQLYFNEESYDNFYLGKGATYPHLYGSLGILFEQASSAGMLATPRGLLSFRENIRTYYRVGISLLENAAAKKNELLTFQQEFAKQSAQMATKDTTKAFVFAAAEDPARMFHFLQLLERNQITVKTLAKDLTINGKTFEAKQAFVVETNQASYRMLSGLFSKITEFENNTFYDVSGWTMPLAFGIDYEPITHNKYQLSELVKPVFPTWLEPQAAKVAYVFEWSHYYAPKLLYQLLADGYLPRIAGNTFTAQTDKGLKTFNRGSVMVPINKQNNVASSKLHQLMSLAAKQGGVEVFSVNSSFTQSVGMDLGSNEFDGLTLPKILLVIGNGMSEYQTGEVWHLLDKRMEIPLVLLDKTKLNSVNLNGYTHLIMVDGKYSDIDKTLTQKINHWVKAGGTLIGIGDGAKWAGKEILELGIVNIEHGDALQQERINYEDKANLEAQDIIGGAVMAGDTDISHPLAYGYSRRTIASHRSGLLAFEPPKNPYATVVKIADKPLLTGFASVKNQQQLAGKSMMVAERLGNGSVVVFADDPNFRGYFYGTEKLFLNSLFFSRIFSKPK